VAEPALLVVGVGNELRGDDAAGIELIRLLRSRGPAIELELREHRREATALLDVWDGRAAVVLVDTVKSGAPAGTVHRLEASDRALPVAMFGRSSTHSFGLGEAIELARTLGRLPARVVVYGVEGASFGAGAPMSAGVRACLPALAAAIERDSSSIG
jgi:hydrogenase maturation protease